MEGEHGGLCKTAPLGRRQLCQSPRIVVCEERGLVDNYMQPALQRTLCPPRVVAVFERYVGQVCTALGEGRVVIVERAHFFLGVGWGTARGDGDHAHTAYFLQRG